MSNFTTGMRDGFSVRCLLLSEAVEPVHVADEISSARP